MGRAGFEPATLGLKVSLDELQRSAVNRKHVQRGCRRGKRQRPRRAASLASPQLSRRANARLLNLLLRSRLEVLEDLAEEEERRRPQADKDGEPLGPGLRVPVGNRR